MLLNTLKILFTCSILFYFSNSYCQWYPQTSNTTSNLNSVFFINHSTGWACGFQIILKTTNGGNTWTNSFLEGYHKSIHFTDFNNGFICGTNGRILKTSNAGNSWESINTGVNTTLESIFFWNQNLGLAVGRNSVILKTNDGGLSWNRINAGHDSINLLSVKILSSNEFLISGSSSTIFKSTDSGNNWNQFSFGVPNPFLTIEFINNNSGWVSGCCGMYMKTTNAGLNWTPEIYLTPGFSIFSMKFINENTGFVVGDGGYILRTTDGGNKWDSLNSNSYVALNSVCFVNNDTGFVVGYNGTILRTINRGGNGYPIGIENNSYSTPQEFRIFQNYPNPFNPTSKIKFQIAKLVNVKVMVLDALGREKEILVNQKLNSGIYETKFDGRNYPSGIYFYQLIISNEQSSEVYRVTKKMILTK